MSPGRAARRLVAFLFRSWPLKLAAAVVLWYAPVEAKGVLPRGDVPQGETS